MPTQEQDTRHGYDVGAVGFARMFERVFDTRPLDRAMIMAFAELADGPVIDVGCGSGVVTEMLVDEGVAACGIDLSPGMIAQARRRRPDLDVRVGSMLALEVPDASVDGVLAWYSTIHVTDADLPTAFAEFYRVLRPNGVVLVGFQVGDEPFIVDEAFGEQMHLVFHRRQPADIVRGLVAAGFVEYSTTVRAAMDERTDQAFVLAVKPSG